MNAASLTTAIQKTPTASVTFYSMFWVTQYRRRLKEQCNKMLAERQTYTRLQPVTVNK